MITYEEIRKNEDIRTYIQSADEALAALGFTEHSFAHVTKVAEPCGAFAERRSDGVPYSGQDGYACGGYCDDCSRHRQP